jgi:hypothetical protein
MKALSRDDAIDATAVPLTRRDGPDAVRNSSKSEKKPPPTSCDGHEIDGMTVHDGTPRSHVVVAGRRIFFVRRL